MLNQQLEIHNIELKNKNNINLDVLRLDKIDPKISGNKIFKLKYYIEEFKNGNFKGIVTLGGPYSNHLLATAAYCKLKQIPAKALVKDIYKQLKSNTLEDCAQMGMEIQFINKENYLNLSQITNNIKEIEGWFFIPEGGFGAIGLKGAEEIFSTIDYKPYTHIAVAMGTATTFAGIVNSCMPNQYVLGFSSLKGKEDWRERLNILGINKCNYEINNNYKFGGYGKQTDELIDFMNSIYKQYHLPLDKIYTAKAFYGILDLIEKRYFNLNTNILFVHTGGLQGNLTEPNILF